MVSTLFVETRESEKRLLGYPGMHRTSLRKLERHSLSMSRSILMRPMPLAYRS
jgi:hypothetical protein